METAYAEDILGLLERLHPATLLAVGATAAQLAGRYRQRHDGAEATLLEAPAAAREVDGLIRHDCALVTDTLERLPTREGAVLVSRLRDLYARYLVLAVPLARAGEANGWTETDLLGLGLVRLKTYPVRDAALGVYTFDLYDYKLTPDWLNAKYWANPELFDKYWW